MSPGTMREADPLLRRLVVASPAPLAGMVLKTTLALLAGALAWAVFGRLDVVAVAPGKLVPTGHVKIVQPPEAGIVRELLVREGETVRAGQVLMRMDPTLSTADRTSLRTEHERRRLALRRIDAELAEQPFERTRGDDPVLHAETLAQAEANRNALAAAIAQEEAARERARQELAVAAQTRDKLQHTLPLYREQEAAFGKLVADGYSGKLLANDKTRERIEKEQDLKAQEFVIARERANLEQSERRIAQLRSDRIRQLRAERAETADRLEKLAQELSKAEHRHGLLELRAPTAGRVKDLATHTAGTVAQPGTILLTLVPDGERLDADVWLSNEDVGFVRPGLPVRLKLAAFPFQKYGMVDGTVEDVGADAAESPGAGGEAKPPPLAYRTRVRLDRQALEADGRAYRLAPGMQVSAEVHLGERSILDYLLSPVTRAWHEAARER